MVTKYDVFNPVDATHTVVDTLEEALKIRQELMDPWVAERIAYGKNIHTITALNTLDSGDVVMSPIDLQGQ